MPKRGENIYKRKDGRWEGRYIRGRSPSGGAVYGYVYACSYRECRVKRQKQLEALGDAPEQAASLTLAQAAGRFLADREKQLKESTRARYAYLLRHYILPGLGETSVGQLTANGISDFLGGLQRGGLSGKSARDVGVLLKSVLKYSTRRLECSCPGLEAELPVYRRKQVSVFSADEVQRLARWVLSAPDGTGVAVLLALNTGLRLGELCALQFGDIDLKSGVVRVSKTVQRIPGEGGTRLAVQPPKSDSSRRAVPLPGDMAALLGQLPRPDSAQRFFLTGTDTPMEPRTMQYRYGALLKAAGITYRNFHALRHPYVKHTTKIFSLRLMGFQAQAYPDARRKTRGACQLHRGGQSRSPVRPLCNRKRFSCLPPQSKISLILYATSIRLSGFTSTRSISSSASSVVSVSASKLPWTLPCAVLPCLFVLLLFLPCQYASIGVFLFSEAAHHTRTFFSSCRCSGRSRPPG